MKNSPKPAPAPMPAPEDIGDPWQIIIDAAKERDAAYEAVAGVMRSAIFKRNWHDVQILANAMQRLAESDETVTLLAEMMKK